jgi:radical SAM protein with 4Fe4S-binding SPASM domain
MVGPEAIKMGFKKTLLMSSGPRGTDIVHNMAESLKYHCLEVVVYEQVESNPKDYNAMDAVKLYQEQECDSFVSIGGGSTHDACKGARISVAHDGRNVNDFEGFNMSENPKNPPHIAISTTAGTGSETSWAYVITDTTTDPDNPHKYVAFDDACVATLAVDDPVLYFECPVDHTAQCGFDVLAHASEPHVSRLNFEPSLGNATPAASASSTPSRMRSARSTTPTTDSTTPSPCRGCGRSAYGQALPGLNLCGAGRVVCLIDPVGDVYACPFAIHESFLAGNILRDGGFGTVWRESELFRDLRAPSTGGACAKCAHFDTCRGGCMAAKFFTGLPLHGPDPECVQGYGEAALAGDRDVPKPSVDRSEPRSRSCSTVASGAAAMSSRRWHSVPAP